jgi:hypothetical protein
MLHGKRLSDAAAKPVSHDACAIDGELVEQLDDSIRVPSCVNWASERAITSTVAEQIEHNEPMARRHEWNDAAPEMARCWEAVDEHDRNTGAARPCGVVVQPCAGEIEKLTAHAKAGIASGEKM